MMLTPVFERLHDEAFTEQCEACKAAGWPVHLFTCIAEDVTCTDF